MSYFGELGIMLTQLVFGLLLLVLVMRMWLPLSSVRFSNPICQFVYKSTNPVIGPLTSLIPPWRKLSVATLLLAFLVTLLEVAILMSLYGLPLQAGALAISSLGGLVYFVLAVGFWAIVIRALMSWFSVDYGNPAVEVLFAITDRLLQPFRKLPPRTAGFDLSPLYAGFVLRAVMLLVEHLVAANGVMLLKL